MSGFVHLHTHTAYSLLDGQGSVKNILDRAKELGMTEMAITDHGNMYGVVEFYEYAKEIGIKPIIGCEVYLAKRSRFDKHSEMDKERYHLTLLAMNNTGYHNLIKIVSKGYTEGFYYKPRVDFELLKEYSEGIIALSGCMFGLVSQRVLDGNYDKAYTAARELSEIFTPDRFYIELQDHGLYKQKRLNSALIKIARELNLKLVCTNDIHYARREDAYLQDVLLCIGTGQTLNDENRFKMDTDELYVKSESEMRELFSYIPEAVDNTKEIAKACNVELEFGKLHLPEFDVPDGMSAREYLRELCLKGFLNRYPGENKDDSEIYKRLCYEIDTIENMGYVDYFLIVRDFIRYAKSLDIPVGPGRGSAAGSVVSYCLGITDVDPIKYDLIFERFLNPERVSMPDIDVDFCYERRQEVIDYVNKKYGEDRVCQIITFGTMAAKQAVRDVGRVMSMPYAVADRVSKLIPSTLHTTLQNALIVSPKLKEIYDSDSDVKKLIDTAKGLEGLLRHASTHAAGVVITKAPVSDYVPISKNENVITTQFTMTTIERLGLLKMDFLGLRTLTVIHDAIDMIEKNHGVRIDINSIDMDDKAVYDMISRGDCDGVFQLESGGMKRFMTELMPRSLEDVIAGISLYRPGPMDSIPTYIKNKNNPSEIRYKHPLLEPILNVTYGCIVYQEQVMRIVRELGGYSLGRADLVRRAMSKKKADVMAKEKHNFVYGCDDEGNYVEGALRRGIDENTAISIFDEMMDFASYAFNKSHAAAYAVVAYRTAWLKCHYAAEFYAALLNSFIDNSTKIAKYISIIRKAGIKIIPPDINKSESCFVVRDGDIMFGMGAIKNVGVGVVDEIVSERNNNGEFLTFTEFCMRMTAKTERRVNKRVVKSLILGGCFDSLKLKRSELIAEHEDIIDRVAKDAKQVVPGQISLFDLSENDNNGTKSAYGNIKDMLPTLDEFSTEELLAKEKECLGMYVSAHPLDAWRDLQFSKEISAIEAIEENENESFKNDTSVRIIGYISSERRIITKTNEYMKYISVDDMTGSMECIVFPSVLRKYDEIIKKDEKVLLSGELDINDDGEKKLKVRHAERLVNRKKSLSQSRLYIRLLSTDLKAKEILKDILVGGGDSDVVLYYHDTKKSVLSPKSMRVNLNRPDERVEKLIDIFGEENVKIKT